MESRAAVDVRLGLSTSLWMFQVNLGIGWTPPPITADEIVKKEDIKVEEDGDGGVHDAVTAKGQRKIQGKKREGEGGGGGRLFCPIPTDLR